MSVCLKQECRGDRHGGSSIASPARRVQLFQFLGRRQLQPGAFKSPDYSNVPHTCLTLSAIRLTSISDDDIWFDKEIASGRPPELKFHFRTLQHVLMVFYSMSFLHNYFSSLASAYTQPLVVLLSPHCCLSLRTCA